MLTMGRQTLAARLMIIGALVCGVVGLVIIVVDWLLKSRGTKFRAHPMPIAVGMYLPFGLATPILIGGLISHFVTRAATSQAEQDRLLHRGILFSSGVIAGEALLGVALAGVAVAGIQKLTPGMSDGLQIGLTAVAAALVLFAFVRISRPKSA